MFPSTINVTATVNRLTLPLLLALVSSHLISARFSTGIGHGTSSETFANKVAEGLVERKAGHTARAIDQFQKAAALAQTSEEKAQALLYASGSQIRSFQFRRALQSADAAHTLAIAAHNDSLAGGASNNKATVYTQLGDHQLALDSAQEAVRRLQRSDRRDHYAMALLNYGDALADLGRFVEAAKAFQAALDVVRQAKLPDQEGLADDHLGMALFQSGEFARAAKAYQSALGIRTAQHDVDGVALTKQHLAVLANEQGEYQRALQLIGEAEASGGIGYVTSPQYCPPQIRGEILAALGRPSEALVAFRRAVYAADKWRQQALPGDVTSTQTTATLHRVYREFVELAAELSLKHHDPVLAREALAVLASSRAASLREQMLASLERQMVLPPRYFELLAQLQASEASLALGANATRTQSLRQSLQRMRNELADLENKVGISQENSTSSGEKVLTRKTLTGIQTALTADQLLLSFSLGSKKSFLWGVSRNALELYQLPAEDVISTHASAYFAGLQKGAASNESKQLSRDLFSQLNPALAARKEWLIAADGALLDCVPFASLPATGEANGLQTLVAAHSLRFLPSEQLLADRKVPQAPSGKFVGVADPIYNLADSRIPHGVKLVAVSRNQSVVSLARLAGSDGEVHSAARTSGMSDIELLTGTNATQAKLLEALARTPSVLHFAVHVIGQPATELGSNGNSALALSLTSEGVPELLTKEAIARLRVPGALVVLSGCASQRGQVVPSAGLIGLGRAWLLAGAAAVVVSAWPTPDDSGEFFSEFYSRLHGKSVRTANLAQRAAAALQETQVLMQRSAGYRSSPSFWAAYSIISEE